MATLMGINKVNWGQVGRVTKPDRYQYSFGWLTIAADDIAIWQKNPNAVFTLVDAAAMKDHRRTNIAWVRLNCAKRLTTPAALHSQGRRSSSAK
ncbi:MAG: hypothetical protein WBF73_00430 [Bradyrhizobium sp.]